MRQLLQNKFCNMTIARCLRQQFGFIPGHRAPMRFQPGRKAISMLHPRRIEGYAVVSDEGMIANSALYVFGFADAGLIATVDDLMTWPTTHITE
jgi:hypothetical protein